MVTQNSSLGRASESWLTSLSGWTLPGLLAASSLPAMTVADVTDAHQRSVEVVSRATDVDVEAAHFPEVLFARNLPQQRVEPLAVGNQQRCRGDR